MPYFERDEEDLLVLFFFPVKYVVQTVERASLIGQFVKNLPAIQETLIQFLGREDLLKKGQATYSCILGLCWWLSW